MKKPNFFIVGAPKCGTSSLAAWLAHHPQIFMSPSKEPHFFSQDIGLSSVQSQSAYEQLFSAANADHSAVGEASTRYLFSDQAVPKLLEYAPDARLIVMLRNPVEMAPSLHQQYLSQGNENIEDFAQAWHAQSQRAAGQSVPAFCHDPKLLLYGPICSLGAQLTRLYKHMPSQRVLVILLEDIRADPRREYVRALEFLKVEDDGRQDFFVVNAASAARSRLLRNTLQILSLVMRRLKLPRPRSGLLKPLHRANSRPAQAPPLPPQMRATLRDYFRDDVAQLSRLIDRDLSHWLALSPAA